jgi:hypothetical protein
MRVIGSLAGASVRLFAKMHANTSNVLPRPLFADKKKCEKREIVVGEEEVVVHFVSENASSNIIAFQQFLSGQFASVVIAVEDLSITGKRQTKHKFSHKLLCWSQQKGFFFYLALISNQRG